MLHFKYQRSSSIKACSILSAFSPKRFGNLFSHISRILVTMASHPQQIKEPVAFKTCLRRHFIHDTVFHKQNGIFQRFGRSFRTEIRNDIKFIIVWNPVSPPRVAVPTLSAKMSSVKSVYISPLRFHSVSPWLGFFQSSWHSIHISKPQKPLSVSPNGSRLQPNGGKHGKHGIKAKSAAGIIPQSLIFGSLPPVTIVLSILLNLHIYVAATLFNVIEP